MHVRLQCCMGQLPRIELSNIYKLRPAYLHHDVSCS